MSQLLVSQKFAVKVSWYAVSGVSGEFTQDILSVLMISYFKNIDQIHASLILVFETYEFFHWTYFLESLVVSR
jgi:hypothetical protein